MQATGPARAQATAAPAAYGDITTADLLASLAGRPADAPVTLRGTVDNTAAGSVLEVKAGTVLGQVSLNGGAVRGGTLRLAGGALRLNADGAYNVVGTLDGVRVLGDLALAGAADAFPGYGAVLALRGGVTFAGLSGTGRGSVTVTGAASELRALDAEVLDHVDLRFIGQDRLVGQALTTAAGTVLALGADASLDVQDLLTLGGGGTLRSAGAVAVRPGGTLAIAPGTTLARTGGSLAVAKGGALSFTWTGAAPLDGLAGAVIDGTLALSGPLTSRAYAAALGGVTGAGGVSFGGTLDNAGAVLSPGDTVAGRLTLSGVLKGGTVTAGTLTLGSATVLDGVAFRGPATLAGVASGSIDTPPPATFFRGGLALLGAGGAGPGALTLSRLSLQAADTERLDNAAVRLLDATLSAADGSRLTLGAGLALDVAGRSGLANATSQGSITVAADATLTVDRSFVNAGRLTLDAGSRLNLSGTTTAGLAALVGGAAGPGTVGLAPNATWDNTGATLVLLANSRLNGLPALNPTLRGGTVTNAGGSLGFTGTVVLDGVTWRGAFAPTARAAFQFRGATTVQGQGGRALIDLAASGSSLELSGALDNTELRMAGGALSTAAAGPVLLGAGTTLSIRGGFSTVSPVRGTASGLSNAGLVTQAGDADYAALTNSGTLAVSHGTARAGTLANSGLITLDAATLTVGAATALGGTVAFLDPTARLVFGGGGTVGATLRDFQYGDSIDLQGLAYGPGLSVAVQGDAVQVSRGGAVAGRFRLSGGAYAADQFSLASDGAGGTLLRTTHRLSAPVAGPGRDFDAAYYLAHNPDVAAARLDPLRHYLDYGWKEGRDPSAFFSTAWYLNQNPDVAATQANPLLHYEDYGWREGRDPGPGFSIAAYLAANPDVATAGIDPLQHFLAQGRAEGRAATPAAPRPVGPQDALVDRAWYLAQHPDVAASGEDASAHYHRVGWRLGYNPDPVFDTTYYLRANPDVAAAGLDPLTQFAASGWREGREPSLAFSDRQYAAANPDVAAAGLNPLAHYLAYGRPEGRPAFINAPQAPAAPSAAPDPLIDRAFYFAQVATIVPAGADAAASYDQGGWRAGRDPDAFFDTSYYLAHNPDVRAAGANPLRHYEDYGWKEERDPSAAFSTAKYLAAYPDARGGDPLASFLATGQAVGRTAFGV